MIWLVEGSQEHAHAQDMGGGRVRIEGGVVCIDINSLIPLPAHHSQESAHDVYIWVGA